MWQKYFISAALILVSCASGATQNRGHQAEIEESLQSRYRLTKIGPSSLGFKGSEGTVRHAGGVIVLRRPGVYATYKRTQMVSMSIRGLNMEILSGEKQNAVLLGAGTRCYVVAVAVADDSVTVGLLTTGTVTSGGQSAPVWASLNFFFDKQTVAQGSTDKIYPVLDEWLLPEGASPEVSAPVAVLAAAIQPAVAPPPPEPAKVIELRPGLARDEIIATIGNPVREVSFGVRHWMEYRGFMVVVSQGKLDSVDPVSPLSGAVKITSQPAGAEIVVDGAFAGSTPSTLQLSPGSHKVALKLSGFADWQRDLQLTAGSEVSVDAKLEK